MSETTEFACSLSNREFRDRRAMIRERILPYAVEKRVIPRGLQVTFAGGDEMRARLEEFITLEHQCCGFLSFDLSSAMDGQALVLTVTGPNEAQNVLRTLAAKIASDG